LESAIESEGTPSSESFEVRNKCLAYVVRYLFFELRYKKQKVRNFVNSLFKQDREKSVNLSTQNFKSMSETAKQKKNTFLVTRINSDLKQVIAQVAHREGLTVTRYLEQLVKNDLRARQEQFS
jgi:macrodomain Ter protein organizer (MatP/YcbG family)